MIEHPTNQIQLQKSKKVGFLDFLLDFCLIIGLDLTEKIHKKSYIYYLIQSNNLTKIQQKIQKSIFFGFLTLNVD
jgi:hypothetical protein